MTAHKALSKAIAELPRVKCHAIGNEAEIRQDKLLHTELPRVKCHALGNEAEIRQDKLFHTSSHLTKSNHVALGVAMHVGHDGSGSSLPRRFLPWPPIMSTLSTAEKFATKLTSPSSARSTIRTMSTTRTGTRSSPSCPRWRSGLRHPWAGQRLAGTRTPSRLAEEWREVRKNRHTCNHAGATRALLRRAASRCTRLRRVHVEEVWAMRKVVGVATVASVTAAETVQEVMAKVAAACGGVRGPRLPLGFQPCPNEQRYFLLDRLTWANLAHTRPRIEVWMTGGRGVGGCCCEGRLRRRGRTILRFAFS